VSLSRKWIPVLVLFVVLSIDQIVKIWVKTHMHYGQEILMLGSEKARLHFVENPGMAFGWEINGGNWGKLLLSVFRIIAISFLGYLIYNFIKAGERKSVIFCFSMVLAGALGNMIDSAFYGMIFSASSYHHNNVATLFPPEGGYASFLHGKVVDMFYFPVISGTWPSWVPNWGGTSFEFFQPVFNVADAAISTGVISLLLFHRSFLSGSTASAAKATADASAVTAAAAAVAASEANITPKDTEILGDNDQSDDTSNQTQP
jgi:signal peptidase II